MLLKVLGKTKRTEEQKI